MKGNDEILQRIFGLLYDVAFAGRRGNAQILQRIQEEGLKGDFPGLGFTFCGKPIQTLCRFSVGFVQVQCGLCVGSVINYCDPLLVISEISRVLKPNAVSVLDFEQSRSYQFIGSVFNRNAKIITSFNSGIDDRIWVFSERLIRSYCKMHGLEILDVHYFHLLTPLIYRLCKDENKAARFVFADRLLSKIPYLRKISCNVILTIKKEIQRNL